jgi:hypothetical protein
MYFCNNAKKLSGNMNNNKIERFKGEIARAKPITTNVPRV